MSVPSSPGRKCFLFRLTGPALCVIRNTYVFPVRSMSSLESCYIHFSVCKVGTSAPTRYNVFCSSAGIKVGYQPITAVTREPCWSGFRRRDTLCLRLPPSVGVCAGMQWGGMFARALLCPLQLASKRDREAGALAVH